MNCPKCGKENKNETLCCSFCGNTLGTQEQVKNSNSQQIETAIQENTINNVDKETIAAKQHSEHSWICHYCGKMATQSPCEHCGDTAPFQPQKNYTDVATPAKTAEKKRKIIICIAIEAVAAIALIIGITIGLCFSIFNNKVASQVQEQILQETTSEVKEQVQKKIADIKANNQLIYFVNDIGNDEIMLYSFELNDNDDIIVNHYYYLAYENNKPDYERFYKADVEDLYHLEADKSGNVFIVLDSIEGQNSEKQSSRFLVTTDEKNHITMLEDEYKNVMKAADQKYIDDLNQYLKDQSRLENVGEIESKFLQKNYFGQSITWQEVLDNTFTDYEIEVGLSDQYEDGYQITISGEYSPNPIDLPEVTYDGTMVFAYNNDLSEGVLISGESVKNACDTYVSLGTMWYSGYGY